MSNTYTSARFIAGLTQIIGWAILLIGIAGAFALQRQLGGAGMALSMIGTTLAGVLLLAAAQITLAVLDTAESTAATADNTRAAVDLLTRIASQPAPVAAPLAQAASPAPITHPASQALQSEPFDVTKYKGYVLRTAGGGKVAVNGVFFDSADAARRWIDQQVSR